MKKQFLNIILLGLVLVACSPEPPYELDAETKIQIDLHQVSAGFIEVEFTPDRQVYYLAAIDKVIPGVNPADYAGQFMQLALDSAYKEFINWRYELLLKAVPVHQIANFKDHALQYGNTNYFAPYLEPDTDYWLYAFVVNPETNKAVSDLFLKTIHTKAKSEIPCKFRYRIKDTWDYIYPIDTITGQTISNFPYAASTMDSVALAQYIAAHPDLMPPTPAGFFTDSLHRQIQNRSESSRVLYGVYAHNNNGYGDGTSSTCFEDGVTYYSAFAGVDGGLVEGQNGIYKFTWHPGLDTVFEPSQSLGWQDW